MLFVHPLFLLSAAALVVPLMIHLLLRNRPKRQVLPTLRFLPSTSPQTIAMHRFKNILLLLLRLAILTLIVLAFSRPYFEKSKETPSMDLVDEGAVVAVDVSMSMRTADRWNMALGRVKTLLDTFPKDTRICLLLFDRSPRVEIGDVANPELVLNRLKQSQPGYGSTDLIAAIRASGEAATPLKARRKRVFLISDFQDTGFDQISSQVEVPEDIALLPIRIDEKMRKNAAITGVLVIPGETPGDRILRVQSTCFGTDTLDCTLEVHVDRGGRIDSREIVLSGEQSQVTDFLLENSTGEDRSIRIRLNAEDDLKEDNEYAVVVKAERPLPVMIPRIAGRLQLGGSTAANVDGLNPYLGAAIAACGERLAPRLLDPSQLIEVSVGEYPVGVVVLGKVLGQNAIAALKKYVGSGGRLVVFPDNDSAEAIESLCDLKSDGWLNAGNDRNQYWIVTSSAPDSPTALLDASGDTILGHPKARRRLSFQYDENDSIHSLVDLDDGGPFLLERKMGSGIIYLFTVPLDSNATDFVLRAAFSPFLYRILEYASHRMDEKSEYSVGDVFVTNSGGTADAQAKLFGADGHAVSMAGSHYIFDTPGIFTVRKLGREFPIQVHTDKGESDLRPMNESRIAGLTKSGVASVGNQTLSGQDILVEEDKAPDEPRRLWWWLLASVLGCMIVETLIASRTNR